nr:FtsX-like permease family protein [Oceanococcus sp. HetDA_MAG_MS8]
MSHRRLLVLCLSLATVVAASTTSLSDRVYRLLAERTAQTMGADLVIQGREAIDIPAEIAAQLSALTVTPELSQPSMVFSAQAQQLVSLRAVGAKWPLKGAVLGDNGKALPALAPQQAWVEQRLADQLDVTTGDQLEVGRLQLTIAGVIRQYPGRGNAGFASLAPELIMRLDDLPGTGLTQAGARSRHILYASGPASGLEQLRLWAQSAKLKAQRPGELRPELGNALERAKGLLDLASLSSLILLAVVVFLLGRFQLPQWAYQTAVLRSLGATQKKLWTLLAWPWLRDGLAAVVVGGGVAIAVQEVLDLMLPRLDVALPMWRWEPVVLSMAAGFSLSLALLPSLYQAARTPPTRIFHQSAEDTAPQLSVALLWTLLCVLIASRILGIGWVIVGASLGVMVLGAALLGLLSMAFLGLLGRGVAPLSARAQLAAQPIFSATQAASLGLGIAIIGLLAGLQGQIIAPWQSQLPADAPNRFVINIQPQQQREFEDLLAAADIPSPRMMPMVRGRLVGLNGAEVRSEDFSDPDTQRWINRDFNLSSAAQLPSDNQLLQGRFWDADSTALELSVDTYAVERLDLTLDSTLSLDFAGQRRQYTVTSIRDVQWDSLQPNFFLLVPPAALPQDQASWITAYYQPPEKAGLDRKLAQSMPNLTILNLDSLIAEIRQITARALLALQIVFGFTLVSGALLVLVMLRASVPQRRQQSAVLRAMGLSRQRLRGLLLREYALLGLLASVGSVLLAQTCLAVLAQQQFDMAWVPQPALITVPIMAGVALSAALGWWQLRSTTTTPPTRLLQES